MRFGVVCVSDRCAAGTHEDKSGPRILELIAPLAQASLYRLVPDEKAQIAQTLIELADTQKVDVILTTGGTGFAPRDVTPEATMAVVDRLAPGISEAIRMKSLAVTNRAMLSRAVSGIRGKTLIINLPGSPKAVKESLGFIIGALDHGLKILRGSASECARK